LRVITVQALRVWAVRMPDGTVRVTVINNSPTTTFGAATTTGELARRYKTTTLEPIRHRYLVELPPGSAALLSLRAS